MCMQNTFVIIVHLLFFIYAHVETTPVLEITDLSNEYINHTNEFKLEVPSVKCNFDQDCPKHQGCKDGDCECEKGWITWYNSQQCSYKQSSKILTFVISFITGIVGMDWFILSRKDSLYILCGILKFLISVGCCIWNPLAAKSKSTNAATAASCLSVTLTFISFVWWFVDWIRVLFNSFPDGNGAPLV